MNINANARLVSSMRCHNGLSLSLSLNSILTATQSSRRFFSCSSTRLSSTPVHSSIRVTSTIPATLHLSSGHSFTGKSFGSTKSVLGETVFTTSITSYTESLTDPSYQGQLLSFTQPLIGNYGVPANTPGQYSIVSPHGNEKDVEVGSFLESSKPMASGVICSDLCDRYSHWESRESLSNWLNRFNVPGISGIDTRALTSLLRDQGSTLGAIKVGQGHEIPPPKDSFLDPMSINLISKVSTPKPYVIHPKGGEKAAVANIALLDFGSKANILRSLLRCNVSVTVLPWNYDFSHPEVRDLFDGLFLSNGPGSPYSIPEAVETTRKVLKEWKRPVFGICMGNQIIGLAAGLSAYRMKFGNRGHNQPVVALSSTGKSVRAGRVYITSQNHGYALDWNHDLPDGGWKGGWKPWFVNANDGSIEGIRSLWAVQFHPEHAGGPEDCSGMFADYISECVKSIQQRGGVKSAGLQGLALGREVEIMTSGEALKEHGIYLDDRVAPVGGAGAATLNA